jgi:hypothetical protein
MKFALENEYYHSRSLPYREGDNLLATYNSGISLVSEGVVRKEALASTREYYDSVSAIVKHFMRHPDPMVVPVYDFQAVEIPASKYGAHRYYYDMMRMGLLSREEKQMIAEISNENWYHHQNFSVDRWMSSNAKLATFMKEVITLSRYHDLHNGNIMKDLDDNYRIIDLEGFQLMPLEQPANAWITRE